MTGSAEQHRTSYDPNIPMQHQIYLDLCKQISDGLWVDRTDFPGGRELTEIYGVSKITAERVLDRLVETGWIERARGRRPRVIRESEPALHRMPNLLQTGRSRPFTYRLLSQDISIAPTEACQAFGVPTGSSLWLAHRLRIWGKETHSVVHHVQLPEIGAQHKVADLRSKSMLGIFAKEGRRVEVATRQFSVQSLSAEDANALDVTLGQPVLTATFVMSDADDVVLQWVRIHLHPSVRPPLETYRAGSNAWQSSENL